MPKDVYKEGEGFLQTVPLKLHGFWKSPVWRKSLAQLPGDTQVLDGNSITHLPWMTWKDSFSPFKTFISRQVRDAAIKGTAMTQLLANLCTMGKLLVSTVKTDRWPWSGWWPGVHRHKHTQGTIRVIPGNGFQDLQCMVGVEHDDKLGLKRICSGRALSSWDVTCGEGTTKTIGCTWQLCSLSSIEHPIGRRQHPQVEII